MQSKYVLFVHDNAEAQGGLNDWSAVANTFEEMKVLHARKKLVWENVDIMAFENGEVFWLLYSPEDASWVREPLSGSRNQK